MSTLPILNAPSFSAPSNVSSLVPNVSVSSATATFNSPVPQMSAPSLTLGSISTPNVPTSAGGIAAAAGINTNMSSGQALQTLGVSTTLSGVGVPVSLPSLQLPQIPNFPGIDIAGINLGAGPKFMANALLKYKTIVPPYVPGLKINMAMVGAAISIVKSASSGNLGGLLTSLTGNLVDGIKDQTGASTVQAQVKDQLTQTTDNSALSDLQTQYDRYQTTVADSAQSVIDNQTNVSTPSP